MNDRSRVGFMQSLRASGATTASEGSADTALPSGASSRRNKVVAAAIGFVVALCTYPVLIADIGWEPDQSWAAALHMAQHQGLVFGRDLVFTYGPLGWITTATMFYEDTGIVAIAVRFPMLVAVAALIWWRLRQLCVWPFAVVGTIALSWMIGSVLLIGGESPLLVLFAIVGPYLLRLGERQEQPLPRWIAPALGSLGAVMLLVKFDVGLYVVGWGLFIVVTDGLLHRVGWRMAIAGVAWLLDGFLITLVVGWLACGQPYSYLWRWLDLAFNLFVGFNDAMATAGPTWELQLAFVSMAGLAVLVWFRATTLPRLQTGILWFAMAGLVVAFAKQGFLRQDSHTLRWWAFVGVATLALASRKTFATAAFLLAPAVVVAGAVAGSFTFTHPGDSVSSVQRAFDQVTSRAERVTVRAWGRHILPIKYPIPVDILRRIRGNTLHIGPVRSVVAWIQPTTIWRPFPILQHYHGFTPKLDRWTADFVRGAKAPRYVLYERFAIDDRLDRWEPPETMMAMLCEYRYVTGSQGWQLFERRAKSACGSRRRIDVVDGRIGEEMFTPLGNDDELVVGSFRSNAFSPGLFGRIQRTLTRPPIMDVLVQDDPNRHRFVMGTSEQDHVLILPACLQNRMGGFDTGTMRSLLFTSSHGAPKPGAAVTATYEAIRFDCSA